MTDILIEISCNGETCGFCDGNTDDYCNIFYAHIDGDKRCAECIDAEGYATELIDFLDSYR